MCCAQTGSGKTYTMIGAPSAPGIMVHTLQDLFQASRASSKSSGVKYKVTVSFLEVYNENIRDLLCDPTAPKQALSIAHSATGQTTVTNAVEEQIEANAGEIARKSTATPTMLSVVVYGVRVFL